MIEQIAYMALLGAPEIAQGATTLAGQMVEGVGRRFASGVYEEISEKLARDTSFLGAAMARAVESKMTGAVGGLQASAARVLAGALQGEGAALASAEELKLLRQIAAEAAEGRDIAALLARLQQFYTQQTAQAPATDTAGA